MIHTRVLCAVLLSSAWAPPVHAQSAPADRPFLFSVTAPQRVEPHASVYVDTGAGERAFDLVQGTEPEQRIGVHAALGHRLTVLARIGFAAGGGDTTHASQQGELLYGIVQSPDRATSVAIGGGLRHESRGVNVLLARLAAGRSFSTWRLDGNALFEKPFSAERDAVDLITTFGVARRMTSWLHLGLELIGEDLEGFWEDDEAEGGARVLVGPSIRVAPSAARWQVAIAGGPVVHATRSARANDAARSLPGTHDGYALRCSFGYGF